mmetsp:Transcript_7088/g.24386  ORF Transcript_7088/g.24386 Transcript_7088/m.24386 type:complete len:287 (-) Transcript_7088:291-1151(-)
MGCHAIPLTAVSWPFLTSACGEALGTSQYRIDPSYPPLTKRSAWCGCQHTLVMSRFWPLYVCSCFMVRMSNTLRTWSLPPLTIQLPFLFHSRHMIVLLWPCRFARHLPALGSHSLIMLSLLQEATSALVGCQPTPLTSPPCPDSWCSTLPAAKSHTLTVVSSELEANLKSEGEKETPVTASRCASGICLALFSVVVQYWIPPPSSPDTSQFSLRVYLRHRTALCWAWMMVSKLKHMPFHRVNSPLWQPVRRRRPPGVHTRAFTGHLILFVLTWTNLVLKLLAGVSP